MCQYVTCTKTSELCLAYKQSQDSYNSKKQQTEKEKANKIKHLKP